ncbi:MAG: hypothetical protein Q4A11_06550 [Brachymonas sp.]|nr:hypothetical protein [Brachymonas sp.]
MPGICCQKVSGLASLDIQASDSDSLAKTSHMKYILPCQPLAPHQRQATKNPESQQLAGFDANSASGAELFNLGAQEWQPYFAYLTGHLLFEAMG